MEENYSVSIELRNDKNEVIDGFYSKVFKKEPAKLNSFWREINNTLQNHVGDTVFNKQPHNILG